MVELLGEALCFLAGEATGRSNHRGLCLQAADCCCSPRGARKGSQKNVVHCSVKPSELTKNLCGTKEKLLLNYAKGDASCSSLCTRERREKCV